MRSKKCVAKYLGKKVWDSHKLTKKVFAEDPKWRKCDPSIHKFYIK